MMDFLAIAFFGWPAIVVTIILSLIGLLRRNYRFLIAASLLALPFSWLLGGYPYIGPSAFLLPLLLACSAYFLSREKTVVAWLLTIPFFASIMLLFNIVAAQ